MNNKITNSSNMKKYQFFEESKEENTDKTKTNNNSTLLIKDISPSGINQMQSIDDIIFICGKAIHKVKSKMVRESLIVKIIDNKIIDEYRIFNGLYYDFKIRYLNNKPNFIILGGELIKYMKDNKEEMLMVTSIKIYDATYFIEPKYEKYNTENIGGENYKNALLKNIQILKKTGENEFVTEVKEGGSSYDGYESFQNIIAFTINSSFSHIAICSDKGDIILIAGYPNLINCNKNEIKMKILPKIVPKDRELYLTNLELAELINKKENKKRILYASTANSVYYYEWKYETEKTSSSDIHIKLKTLIENGKGVYNCCLNSKNNYLLLATSNDNYILEYKNLILQNSWNFDGNKIFTKYYKNYILFIIYNNKYSTIQIYDKTNNFLVYNNDTKKKIISVCCNSTYIYVFFEEKQNLKYIVKIKEKENKKKFEIFYSKNQYNIATDYAKKINSGPEKIAEISQRYAEYLYSKSEYDQSIQQYIKTINYLEPNNVIQKFLEKAKLDYLIQYLEAIENNVEFQKKGNINNNDYAILLFNCYILQEKIGKLKDFIKNKNKKNDYNILKIAVDVCLDTKNESLALSIAKQKNMNEEIMEILISKMNKIKDALDHLLPPKNNSKENKKQINSINSYMNEENDIKEVIYLAIKYGEKFLKENKSQIPDIFFNRISSFIDEKKSFLDQKDITNLIQVFIASDKYFKLLFDKMDIYGFEYSPKIIHRRIELYLENKEKDYKEKIKQMLIDKKYINKYDINHLKILFNYHNFNEGLESLTTIINNKQDVIQLYMSKKNYNNLIEIVDNIIKNNVKYKDTEDYFDIHISFIPIILKFFISEKKNNKKSDINFDDYIQKIIGLISNSNIFIPADFIDILFEMDKDMKISDINDFMNTILNKELVSIGTYIKKFNEIKNQLTETESKIKELNTKAICFNLKKCDECNMSINFPCICFFCGHCYHQLCVDSMKSENIDSNNNLNNKISKNKLKCPKCIKILKNDV